MDNDNHYVTVEEYQRLLAMAQQQSKEGWFSRFVGITLWIFNGCAGVILIWLFVPMLLDTPAALPPPTNAQGTPYPTPYPTAPRQTGGGYTTSSSGGGGNSLPSCADVTNTRTACQPAPEEQAPAAAQELPTEPPAPTATPAYMTACWTEPGQRPCWLPADQPWTPPASVPATPIVAVEDSGWHAPLVVRADVCADWHPPAPYPEECQ